jgi:hypothetical protein
MLFGPASRDRSQQDARLAEGYPAVVGPDQLRTRRHEEEAPRRAVVDVLRDLRGDQARQVGLDAGDQSRRYECACLQDLGPGRVHQPAEADGAAICRSVEKGELAVCMF